MPTFAWFTRYRVTCDWPCHRARGSLGGEDRAHPLGSPVLAPYDGVVTYGYYDDGASYAQVKYANGYAHQAIHVQAVQRLPQGTRVSEGAQVAISGGMPGMDGAGTSDGPHVHFQGMDPSGRRIPWQDVPAPYGSNSVAGQQEEDDMPLTQQDKEEIARYVWANHGDTGGTAWDRLVGIDEKTEKPAIGNAVGDTDIFGTPLSTRLRGIDDKTGAVTADAIATAVATQVAASLHAVQGVDPAQIAETVKKAVSDALAGVKLTFTTGS